MMREVIASAFGALLGVGLSVAQVLNVGLTMQAELTGDGVDDEIKAGRSVVVEDGMSGNKYVVVRADALPESCVVRAYAIDLDKKAPNELVVEARYPSGNATSAIYSLKGGQIKELGTLGGAQLTQSDLSGVILYVAPNAWDNGDKIEGWSYPAVWNGTKWTAMPRVSIEEDNPVVAATYKEYSYRLAPGEALSYRARVKTDDLTLTISKTEEIVVPPSGTVTDTIRTTKESRVLERHMDDTDGQSGCLVSAFPTVVRFRLSNGNYSSLLGTPAAARLKVEKYARGAVSKEN